MAGRQDPACREDTILINAAYDRTGRCFDHDYGCFLAQIAQAVRELSEPAEVWCGAHSLEDEKIAFDLRREHGRRQEPWKDTEAGAADQRPICG